MDPSSDLCDCCQQLFTDHHERVPYGSYIGLLERAHCSLCQFLAARLQKDCDGQVDSRIQCWLDIGSVQRTTLYVCCHPYSRPLDLRIYTYVVEIEGRQSICDDHRPTPSVTTVPLKSSETDVYYHEGNGSMINTELVRGFIANCEEDTTGHWSEDGCGLGNNHEVDIDILLIDVIEGCIVKRNTSSRYLTLSYVWGQCEVFRLVTENYEDLQHPGSLDAVSLPNLVQDAITLVKGIQERYLWVDALCIIQNDAENTSYYVDRMDKIYSRSILTIVAASGTSTMDSLPGTTSGRRLPQYIIISKSVRIVCPQPIRRMNPYATRAWTFQEIVLSRRCLLIFEDEAVMYCPSSIRSDLDAITVWTQEKQSEFNPLQNLRLLGKFYREPSRNSLGDFTLYAELVMLYTPRHMSDDRDVLRAFSGISTWLETKMCGRMVLGMPTNSLTLALSWTCRCADDGTLQRRLRATGVSHDLPSWTWAGWKGGTIVWYPFLDQSHFGEPNCTRAQYTPLVTPTIALSESKLSINMTAYVVDTREFHFQQLERTHSIPRQSILKVQNCAYLHSHFPGFWILHKSHSFADGLSDYRVDTKSRSRWAESELPRCTQRGGLVLGAEMEALVFHDTSFVLLSSWAFPFKNVFWEKHHFTENLHARSATGVYYYTFLLVRWIDRERGICERIGVAHMIEELWRMEDIAKREQEVILV